MEYSHDGHTVIEMKNLTPGKYERRGDKLFILENHHNGGDTAYDIAADKFQAALESFKRACI
jgi:hypothetical protein